MSCECVGVAAWLSLSTFRLCWTQNEMRFIPISAKNLSAFFLYVTFHELTSMREFRSKNNEKFLLNPYTKVFVTSRDGKFVVLVLADDQWTKHAHWAWIYIGDLHSFLSMEKIRFSAVLRHVLWQWMLDTDLIRVVRRQRRAELSAPQQINQCWGTVKFN